MDGEPDILSSGSPEGTRRHVPWPDFGQLGRAGRAAVVAAGVLLVCLAGGLAYLGLRVSHDGHTISGLRAALRATPRPSATAQSYTGSTMLTFPDGPGGSFAMVAVAVSTRSGPLTWLYVHGQHAVPGARYWLVGGACPGENLISYPWSAGVADRNGNLTIVAPELSIDPRDPRLWVKVQRFSGGAVLGGIRGPFVGGGAKPFRSVPPC